MQADLENVRMKCRYHSDHEVIFTVSAMKKMINYIDTLDKPAKAYSKIDVDGPEGYELIVAMKELRDENMNLKAENVRLRLKLNRQL